MFEYENEYSSKGYKLIAGVDEAGRGPLCGPVVCACVIMPLEEDKIIEGINDSKKLTEKKRNNLYDKIINTALAYSVVFVDEKTIDEINILNATKLGMKKCIGQLKTKPDFVLVDAVKGLDIETEYLPIIKGDAKSYSIAAASILAKVSRDKHLIDLDKEYPQYEFARHKGYGTKLHIEKLKEFGPCPIHRKTFIKNFIGD